MATFFDTASSWLDRRVLASQAMRAGRSARVDAMSTEARLARLGELCKIYDQEALLGRFFAPPPAIRPRQNGSYLEWESGYTPWAAEVAESYSAFEANRTALARTAFGPSPTRTPLVAALP